MKKKILALAFLLAVSAPVFAGVKDAALAPVNVLGKAFEDFSTCVVNAAGDIALGTVGTMKNLYGAVTGQDLKKA